MGNTRKMDSAEGQGEVMSVKTPHTDKAIRHLAAIKSEYVQFCVELAAAYREGEHTQEELGEILDMRQSAISKAVAVGQDERIILASNTLPKSTYTIYLLTTLDDASFNKLCKPTTTVSQVQDYKRALASPHDIWAKTDAAYERWQQAHVEWCTEIAAAYREGEATKKEIAAEYDISLEKVQDAIDIGSGKRPIRASDFP